jgi:hypothetical protein
MSMMANLQKYWYESIIIWKFSLLFIYCSFVDHSVVSRLRLRLYSSHNNKKTPSKINNEREIQKTKGGFSLSISLLLLVIAACLSLIITFNRSLMLIISQFTETIFRLILFYWGVKWTQQWHTRSRKLLWSTWGVCMVHRQWSRQQWSQPVT